MTPQIIEITIENDNSTHWIKEGDTIEQLLTQSAMKPKTPIVAAFVNNNLKELSHRIFLASSIRFIELNTSEGRRAYSRSLFFMIEKATNDIFPNSKVEYMHPVGHGFYCEIDTLDKPTPEQVMAIKNRMKELVKADIPIVKTKIRLSQAEDLCRKKGMLDKLLLLKNKPKFFVPAFNLGGFENLHLGAMVTSTKYLEVFDVEPFAEGLAVKLPRRDDHTKPEPLKILPKLNEIFHQYNDWGEIIGVSNIGELNQHTIDDNSHQIIKITEALHEKNFSTLADSIAEKWESGAKIILIAGPSSSGKTTSSKRIAIQLQVLGFNPEIISLDDYFIDRDQTPIDEFGEPDFESIQSVNVERFNTDLNNLILGETTTLPRYDFKTGKSVVGKTVAISKRSIIIVEGIHALNPDLVPHIEREKLYKVYVSALTTLSIDISAAIHTTDNRLIRRIVRDHNYRGRTAYETIKGWQSVRRGEEKNIFPYQEEADKMVNTALSYELAVFAPIVRPLLASVPENAPEFAEAKRLLIFIDMFIPIDERQVPPTSLIREFIGGSGFNY